MIIMIIIQIISDMIINEDENESESEEKTRDNNINQIKLLTGFDDNKLHFNNIFNNEVKRVLNMNDEIVKELLFLIFVFNYGRNGLLYMYEFQDRIINKIIDGINVDKLDYIYLLYNILVNFQGSLQYLGFLKLFISNIWTFLPSILGLKNRRKKGCFEHDFVRVKVF